jgi:hypothetical protein
MVPNWPLLLLLAARDGVIHLELSQSPYIPLKAYCYLLIPPTWAKLYSLNKYLLSPYYDLYFMGHINE